MSSLAEVKAYLSLSEVKRRYRSSKDVTTRSHWHIIWLRYRGMTTREVAKMTGFREDWVRRIVRRYNARGPDSLGDLRRFNRGQEPVLNERQQAKLLQALQGPAPDGGLWNGPKVSRWIHSETGVDLSHKGGWLYLRRLGMTIQLPRPKHSKSSEAERKAFKKKSRGNLRQCESSSPDRRSSCGHRTKLGSD